jgi:ABC-type branched-subunit amino acid transport system substrate-binding protein
MKQEGSKLAFDKPVSKEANDTDAAEVIQEMKAAGVQNAFVLTSPTFLIQLLKAADQNQYHPQWVGVGLTMTFDVVANVSCPNIDGARFFSPFPAWSDRNKFDPDFEKAWQKFYGGTSDDFEWSEWSLDKLIWDAFQMTGPNMSRQSFINTLSHAHNLSNGIGPTLNYTPQDRFGANSVHLDQAQCSGSNGAWHTIRSFVTHF